jgi:hypothetical protein
LLLPRAGLPLCYSVRDLQSDSSEDIFNIEFGARGLVPLPFSSTSSCTAMLPPFVFLLLLIDVPISASRSISFQVQPSVEFGEEPGADDDDFEMSRHIHIMTSANGPSC